MPSHGLMQRIQEQGAWDVREELGRRRPADHDAGPVRDGAVQDIPETGFRRRVQVDGPRHPRAAVGVDLEIGTPREGPRDLPAIESELQAAGRARRGHLEDRRRDMLLLPTGQGNLTDSDYVDIALVGDISTKGYRADEPRPDKVPAHRVIENLCDCFTEQGDLVNPHPPIMAPVNVAALLPPEG